MAEITKKPEGLPSGNDLDKIDDDLLGRPQEADIQLAGKTLTSLASPPGPGETVVLMIRLRVYDEGVSYGDNGLGEGSPYKKTKLVSCWLPGQKEPEPKKTKEELDAEEAAEAAKNQAPLYETDEKGAPVGEPEGDGEPDPEDRSDGDDDDETAAADNVARPNFSHQDGA